MMKTKCKPPLKWAGGKYRLLDKILEVLPQGKRLIEPFVGAGSVFLNTEYETYLINDKNTDLINFYQCLKNKKVEFIAYAELLFDQKYNNKESYYKFREEFNTTTDVYRKSALFLYINKFGFNGLIRYNLSGKLNVPFGTYKKPYFPKHELLILSDRLNQITITNNDFEITMNEANQGDIIYCDPPYVPLNPTSGFTTYSAGGFKIEDQKRLACLAEDLSKKGISIIISNHATDITLELYKNASTIQTFLVQRMISCKGSKREKAKELLAIY